MENNLFQWRPHVPMRLSIYSLVILALFAFQISSAAIILQDGTSVSGEELIASMNNSSNISATPFPIQFFYNTHCGSCQASLEYLKEFTTNHSEIGVEHHDLYNNTESFALYEDYKKQFNRTDIHYPIIFMGNVGIMGSDDIETYTEPLTLWYQKNVKKDPITGLVSWVASFTKEN